MFDSPCPSFGWARVIIFPSGWYDAVLDLGEKQHG